MVPEASLAEPLPCLIDGVSYPSAFIRAGAKFSHSLVSAHDRSRYAHPLIFAAMQQLRRKVDISFGTSRHWLNECTAHEQPIGVLER